MNKPMTANDFIWRPIDSAPKDGTPILCFTPDQSEFGFIDTSKIEILWWASDEWQNDCDDVFFQPTHWMPLPNPPTKLEQKNDF